MAIRIFGLSDFDPAIAVKGCADSDSSKMIATNLIVFLIDCPTEKLQLRQAEREEQKILVEMVKSPRGKLHSC